MWFEVKRGTIEKTLKSFGLSEKQAEIFIFLGKRGPLKGGEITKRLKMNKGQVYCILRKLQKKGLVEETLEFPARFIAVPFEKVIDSFVKSKREEVAHIEETKKDLLSDWENIRQTELDFPLEKFSVIEGNKKIFNKISQMVKETNSQFSMAFTISDLFQAENHGIFDVAKNRLQKSTIKFQVLTQLSKQNLKAIKNLVANLKPKIDVREKNPNLGSPTFTRMAIQDNKEIILFISDKSKMSLKNWTEVCLSTNCKSIIEAFSCVFKDDWRDSADIEDRIIEIETGKTSSKTQIIKNPTVASETYYNALNLAEEEILIVTSLQGVNRLLERLKNKKRKNDGVKIRVMSPITGENLGVAQKLMDYCEIRHIPVGYLETTIIDGQHLFQFKNSLKDTKPKETAFFKNTFYTNDSDYVKQTQTMINNIWMQTRVPFTKPLESLARSTGFLFSASSGNSLHQTVKKINIHKSMEHSFIDKKEVLDVFSNGKEYPVPDYSQTTLPDIVRYFGTTAFALIHPPTWFNLPDMILGIFNCNGKSSFGPENVLYIYLQLEPHTDFSFVPVAVVQNNSHSTTFRRIVMSGTPAENNIQVVKKNDLLVKMQGNTLFAGWTKPISLVPSKFVLPPSCILLEGYGDIKSGLLDNILPSGQKSEVMFNSLEAFVTFFHPSSKYSGPGTEGFIDKEMVFTSYAKGNY